MKYKWQDGFSSGLKDCPKLLIERVFDRLNDGTIYNDVNGKFIGHISAIDGPLGIIHIYSDYSLGDRFCYIKVIYLDKRVLYLLIDDNKLNVYKFNSGRWANII